MNFWIGTSGFQYLEWKGNFYPEDLPTAKMLPFYAKRISTTEIITRFDASRAANARQLDRLTSVKFRSA